MCKINIIKVFFFNDNDERVREKLKLKILQKLYFGH